MKPVIRFYDRSAGQWLNPDDLDTTASAFGDVYPAVGDTIILSAGGVPTSRSASSKSNAWTVTSRVIRTTDWYEITLVVEPGDQALIDQLFAVSHDLADA